MAGREEQAVGTSRSLLFVDDDPVLQTLVPETLRRGGYHVEVAANVSDALGWLKARPFDVVLSDLNIGEPSDGFTVVSAARRIHPEALTLIITGFPDFQGALKAIRMQADDYLVKPVAPPYLLHILEERMRSRSRREYNRLKRVAEVLRDHKDYLLSEWLSAVTAQADFAAIPLSDSDRLHMIAAIVDEVIVALEDGRPELSSLDDLSSSAREAAREHGRLRRRQRYTIRMMLREARVLQREIYRVQQAHLLEIEISQLIPDMIRATDTMEALMTESVTAYLTA